MKREWHEVDAWTPELADDLLRRMLVKVLTSCPSSRFQRALLISIYGHRPAVDAGEVYCTNCTVSVNRYAEPVEFPCWQTVDVADVLDVAPADVPAPSGRTVHYWRRHPGGSWRPGSDGHPVPPPGGIACGAALKAEGAVTSRYTHHIGNATCLECLYALFIG